LPATRHLFAMLKLGDPRASLTSPEPVSGVVQEWVIQEPGQEEREQEVLVWEEPGQEEREREVLV
jgi:hypothetical protein